MVKRKPKLKYHWSYRDSRGELDDQSTVGNFCKQVCKMKVTGNLTGFIESVVDDTSTSLCITQTKRAEKGINCTNWFDMTLKENKQRFTFINK